MRTRKQNKQKQTNRLTNVHARMNTVTQLRLHTIMHGHTSAPARSFLEIYYWQKQKSVHRNQVIPPQKVKTLKNLELNESEREMSH